MELKQRMLLALMGMLSKAVNTRQTSLTGDTTTMEEAEEADLVPTT